MTNSKKPSKSPDKIIHQTNSQLAVLWGYVQLLEKKLESGSTESEWLKKISVECENIKKSIEELKKLIN